MIYRSAISSETQFIDKVQIYDLTYFLLDRILFFSKGKMRFSLAKLSLLPMLSCNIQNVDDKHRKYDKTPYSA